MIVNQYHWALKLPPRCGFDRGENIKVDAGGTDTLLSVEAACLSGAPWHCGYMDSYGQCLLAGRENYILWLMTDGDACLHSMECKKDPHCSDYTATCVQYSSPHGSLPVL